MPVWLNWIEHQTSNLKVTGSSPVSGEFFKTRLAQLVERTTFNRVVEGSSPSSGVIFKTHSNYVFKLVCFLGSVSSVG